MSESTATDADGAPLEGDPPESDDGIEAPLLGEDGALLLDDVEVRDLLRGALRPPRTGAETDVLGDVQSTLRQQSDGRYFADGWALSDDPRGLYLVTSVVVLAALAFIYFILTPIWG